MGQYCTAEVCLNGHPTTASIELSPELRSKHCSECGANTIVQCPCCSAGLRGYYDSSSIVDFTPYSPPSYCHNCGHPLPWTQEKISVAQELVDELEGLSPDERSTLKESILDLTRDSPRTELASLRYKRLIAKSGKVVGQALNSVVASIATEAAKQLLGTS